MIIFSPMSSEEYIRYLETVAADYAKDNVTSGRWPAKGALARSKADLNTLLPQGLATPNHYLFDIKLTESGPTVGVLWFAIVEQYDVRSAFVYDIKIEPEFRHQGHAKAAFAMLEQRARALGLSSIGLHVFRQNTAAQALYSKLGYNVTGINMLKKLTANKH